MRRWRYDITVEDCFYGFARLVYDQVLEYEKLETLELSSDWESKARGWMNWLETVGESADGSVFVVEKKEMDPW